MDSRAVAGLAANTHTWSVLIHDNLSALRLQFQSQNKHDDNVAH